MNRTDQKKEQSPVSVGLLLHDLKMARQISAIFRKIGVLPFIYENLEEYWFGALEQSPTLSIIDVRLMSQGHRTLKNHPMVKVDELAISFYFESSFSPLVQSTYDIFHMGLIQGPSNLEGQIKNILKRLNRFTTLKVERQGLGLENQKISSQFQNIMKRVEGLKEENFYLEELKRLCFEFEKARYFADDFFKVCELVFSQSEEIVSFTFMELGVSGKKLHSPALLSSKFKKIPSVWLGQKCKNGISVGAQTMASQIVVDLMGGELISLLIKGRDPLPEKLVYLKLRDLEFLNKFDWDFFERFLSGINQSFHLRIDDFKKSDESLVDPWSLNSILDQVFYSKLDFNLNEQSDVLAGGSLITVDFTNLVESVRGNLEKRFYWERFYKEFISRLFDQLPVEVRYCPSGVYDLLFFVSSEKSDQLFSHLSQYVASFSFWKYFEDMDSVLARQLTPKIRMIPSSVEALLLYQEAQMIGENLRKNSMKEIENSKKRPLIEGAYSN